MMAVTLSILLRYSDFFLFSSSHKISQVLVSKKNHNMRLLKLDFDDAKLYSIHLIGWNKVSARISVNDKKEFFCNKDIFINADNLKIQLTDLFKRQFILSADGITMSLKNNNDTVDKAAFSRENSLEKGSLKIWFHFDFLDIKTFDKQIRGLFEKISSVLYNGKTTMPLDFSGIYTFNIKNEPVKARLSTHYDDKFYSIRVNKEFFKVISWMLQEELTEPEIELLSENTFKIPKLLRIKNIAQNKSEKMAEKNNNIPEDAYRHVLWSYLLAMEYGTDFAEKVTNAHEEGDITNTKWKHQMDYNNNAIGREYALAQYKENAVLLKLLQDPRVIRKKGHTMDNHE